MWDGTHIEFDTGLIPSELSSKVSVDGFVSQIDASGTVPYKFESFQTHLSGESKIDENTK